MKKKSNSIILAFRLKTLPAVLGPIIVAISISSSFSFDISKVILVLLIGIFLQILVNLFNDLQDSNKGIDNKNRAGPIRAIQSGTLSIPEMKKLISVIIFICLLLGIIAFSISLISTWFIKEICLSHGIVEMPKADRWNSRSVAKFGGVAIFISLLLSLILLNKINSSVLFILIVSSIIFF